MTTQACLLSGLLLFPAVSGGQDLRALARQAEPSVVVLKVWDRAGRESSGTGFFVDPEGWLVTNFHVVEGAQHIEAITASQQSLELGGILRTDKVNDLALLKFGPGPFLPLDLAGGSRVEPGETIVVLGGPLGLGGSLSDGIVSAIRDEDEIDAAPGERGRVPLLQITAPISPGSSGSPVMTLQGEVVGVAVGQLTVGQNLNFAVPVQAVKTLLEDLDPMQEAQPLGRRMTISLPRYAMNLAISALFFTAIGLAFRYMKQRS